MMNVHQPVTGVVISKHWIELTAVCHSFNSCESPCKKGKLEIFFWPWLGFGGYIGMLMGSSLLSQCVQLNLLAF